MTKSSVSSPELSGGGPPGDAVLARLDRLALIFVAGKGGVGKTTTTYNLVLRGLCKGKRMLHVVIGAAPGAEITPSRGTVPPPLAVHGERYRSITLDGKESFREYVLSKIPGGGVVAPLLGHGWMEVFASGAPGLKELVVLGRIVHELQHGRYDQLVVDLPATGHAFDYLRMPVAAAETFARGVVGAESRTVVDTLRDEKRTGLVPVTLTEELSVAETSEYVERFRSVVGIPLPGLIVNRVVSRPPMLDEGMVAGVMQGTDLTLLRALHDACSRRCDAQELGLKTLSSLGLPLVLCSAATGSADEPIVILKEFER